jgi:hypothetical protein
MVQRHNGSRFLLESFAVLFLELLDRHDPVEAGIPRLSHFFHSARTYGREDFVWTQLTANFQCHHLPVGTYCFSSSNQLVTMLMRRGLPLAD